MGSDVPPQYWQKSQGYALSFTVATVDEARRLFQALTAGGTVSMVRPDLLVPGYGMATDRFGIRWMVMARPAN